MQYALSKLKDIIGDQRLQGGEDMNNSIQLQQVSEDQLIKERDRARKAAGILSSQLLKKQNALFGGTEGVSQNNRGAGFAPAYRDEASGVAVISSFSDGRPAPVHVLDGLPDGWVLERDVGGHVTKARPGVVAGFLREGRFYTREEAVLALSH